MNQIILQGYGYGTTVVTIGFSTDQSSSTTIYFCAGFGTQSPAYFAF